jgi:hypothetical protein
MRSYRVKALLRRLTTGGLLSENDFHFKFSQFFLFNAF